MNFGQFALPTVHELIGQPEPTTLGDIDADLDLWLVVTVYNKDGYDETHSVQEVRAATAPEAIEKGRPWTPDPETRFLVWSIEKPGRAFRYKPQPATYALHEEIL